MKKPKHPCKKDCPERTGECKITCKRWQKYEQEKQAYLNEQNVEWQHRLDIEEHVSDAVRKNIKKGVHR